MADGTLLEAEDLTLARRGEPVVRGASLRLEAGERRELTAPSGGGKTTLLLGLARRLPSGGGQLRLEGRLDQHWPGESWRGRVIHCPQLPVALPGSVADNLTAAYQLRLRQGMEAPAEPEMRREMEALGLGALSPEAPAAELSGGQLARLALLRALLARPRVLLLDEPDAMLDANAAARLDARLDEFLAAGGAVICASHRPRQAALAWRMVDGHLDPGAEGSAP